MNSSHKPLTKESIGWTDSEGDGLDYYAPEFAIHRDDVENAYKGLLSGDYYAFDKPVHCRKYGCKNNNLSTVLVQGFVTEHNYVTQWCPDCWNRYWFDAAFEKRDEE